MPKTIPATNDPSVLFIVDEEDYEDLIRFSWYSQQGYAQGTGGEAARMPMHRYLMAKRFDLAGLEVDHCNGLRGDNRKCNLRVCTASQNQRNRSKQTNNTSGYKGVFKDKQRWSARLGFKGGYVLAGNFKTPLEAAIAYDVRAIEMYGEFARLNCPEPDAVLLARVKAYLASAKKREGRSRYRGVSFNCRWRAVIKVNGQNKHLGYFDTEEEAAQAVDAGTISYGLKRPLNFPHLSIT